MDGALSFTHVCVDSSQTVLEHHRPFHPYLYVYYTYSVLTNVNFTQFRILVLVSPVMLMLFVRGKGYSLMASPVLANLHLQKEVDSTVQVCMYKTDTYIK